MIAEIIPDAYDAVGGKVFRPDLRRKGPHPSFPMGRYLSQPLTVKCETISDLRSFLSTCRGVSDKEQFGKDDYWQPPEHFEKTRKGDCDDFALWTWRQLLAMDYDARFVVGRSGRYGRGHAWVTFQEEGKHYLVEPFFWPLGARFPRLTTLRYRPEFSVGWDGEKVSFYAHKDLARHFRMMQLPWFLIDWIVGWGFFWFVSLLRLPRMLWQRGARGLSHPAGTPPSVP